MVTQWEQQHSEFCIPSASWRATHCRAGLSILKGGE